MADSEKIVAVCISGSVQGVGFRAFVQREAECRGISGFVRNRRNGDVEALFAGSIEAVDALVAACSSGPARARVAHLAVYEPQADALVELPARGFHLLPSV
ncbi:MAG: acylphosphatase [Methylovirgula sp.]